MIRSGTDEETSPVSFQYAVPPLEAISLLVGMAQLSVVARIWRPSTLEDSHVKICGAAQVDGINGVLVAQPLLSFGFKIRPVSMVSTICRTMQKTKCTDERWVRRSKRSRGKNTI